MTQLQKHTVWEVCDGGSGAHRHACHEIDVQWSVEGPNPRRETMIVSSHLVPTHIANITATIASATRRFSYTSLKIQ
jgi:hypothetical protein